MGTKTVRINPHSPVSHEARPFDDAGAVSEFQAHPSTNPDRWFDIVEAGCRRILSLPADARIVARPDAAPGSLEEYAFEIGVRVRQAREAVESGDARRAVHAMQGVVDFVRLGEIEHGFGAELFQARSLARSRRDGGAHSPPAATQWREAARALYATLPPGLSESEKARRISDELRRSGSIQRPPSARTVREFLPKLANS